MTAQDSIINPHQNQILPKNWLVESILVTIFCCQILGIIGIIYATSVESKFYRGDIVGAENASRTAKTLVIVSIAFGIITIITVGIIAALGMFVGYYNN